MASYCLPSDYLATCEPEFSKISESFEKHCELLHTQLEGAQTLLNVKFITKLGEKSRVNVKRSEKSLKRDEQMLTEYDEKRQELFDLQVLQQSTTFELCTLNKRLSASQYTDDVELLVLKVWFLITCRNK